MIKTSLRLMTVISLGLLLIAFPRQSAQGQEVMASYQTFYDELAPYGQWVTDAQYGDVWVPNAEAGFRPYATNGHWAMTEYGNMWLSDDPYGWAVYHYGRWTYNSYYGWVWIPGHEWAPAWVSWRSGGGYYGWAPMGPGYEAGGSYAYPDNYWVFVGPGDLYRPNPYSYYDYNRNYYFIQHTGYMHEMYEGGGARYNYGPRSEMIERETHQPVQVYHVSNSGRERGTSVNGNTVSIYRPTINAASERTSRPPNPIRASQPIGKPQEINRGQETATPGFRQEVQQRQAQQTRMQNSHENYGGNGQNMNTQQQAGRQQHFQQQSNQQYNQPDRSQPSNNREQQNFNQQARQQPAANQQQTNRQQPQQQQMNRAQPQQPQQRQPAHQQAAPREEPNKK